MSNPTTAGYAPVNGVEMYWESRGSGGTPLVVVHGGFGLTSMFGTLLDQLAGQRQVIAIELQGHGHTRDIDRPFSYEAFGADIAGVIDSLGLGQADLLGYSLGGGASLRCASQHPASVRRLALVSVAFRRDGWFPEVRAAFDQMSSAGFDQMRQSPMYQSWCEVAPDRDAFPALMDKTGDLLRQPYDWTEDGPDNADAAGIRGCRQHPAGPRRRVLRPARRWRPGRWLGWFADHQDAAGHPARTDPLRHLHRPAARGGGCRLHRLRAGRRQRVCLSRRSGSLTCAADTGCRRQRKHQVLSAAGAGANAQPDGKSPAR